MKTVNIVSLWDLGKKVRLLQTLKAFKAEAIKQGSNCLLLFESGKIIATGFKTFNDAGNFIKPRFASAKFIKIVKITAVAFIRGKIDTTGLNYEPEIYPAYIWKKSKVCIVYYASGKLVVTGGKSHKELREAYHEFREKTSINRNQH